MLYCNACHKPFNSGTKCPFCHNRLYHESDLRRPVFWSFPCGSERNADVLTQEKLTKAVNDVPLSEILHFPSDFLCLPNESRVAAFILDNLRVYWPVVALAASVLLGAVFK